MRTLLRPGPTDRWSAHPVLGASLRIAVLLVPIAVAVAMALFLANVVPLPAGTPARVGWWVVVLGGSTAALLLTDRAARRLLPLAILLELSLVFPDRAPSRLRAARTVSVREMESRLGKLRAAGFQSEPIEAAETLVTLVSILGLHDSRTRGHSERVRALTDLLSAELDLPEADRVRLRWAALVHDLGKLTVPTSVLNGGRDLSEDQWAGLRRHPEEGVRLVAGLMPWLGEWGRAVGEHHERWDGTGYPAGLSGDSISYAARIVSVADSFETMTAARSYSKARSAAAARAELTRCAGTQFDPAVVRAFLGISVGRLQWVLGPLTWLAEVPFVAAVDRAGQAVKAGAVTAMVGTLVIFGGVPVPTEATEPPFGDPANLPFFSTDEGAPAAATAGDAGVRLLGTSTGGARTASEALPAVVLSADGLLLPYGSQAQSGGLIGGPAVAAAAVGGAPAVAGGLAAPPPALDPATGLPVRPPVASTADGAQPPAVPGVGLPGAGQPDGVPGRPPGAGREDDDRDDDKGNGNDRDNGRGNGATPATPATPYPGQQRPATPASPATPPHGGRDDRNDGEDRDRDEPNDDGGTAGNGGGSQSDDGDGQSDGGQSDGGQSDGGQSGGGQSGGGNRPDDEDRGGGAQGSGQNGGNSSDGGQGNRDEPQGSPGQGGENDREGNRDGNGNGNGNGDDRDGGALGLPRGPVDPQVGLVALLALLTGLGTAAARGPAGRRPLAVRVPLA